MINYDMFIFYSFIFLYLLSLTNAPYYLWRDLLILHELILFIFTLACILTFFTLSKTS